MSNPYYSWLANRLIACTVGASNTRWFTSFELHQMAYCFLLSSKFGTCRGPLGSCDQLAAGVALKFQPVPKAECPCQPSALWPVPIPAGGQALPFVTNVASEAAVIRADLRSERFCMPNKKTWRRLRHEFASALDHMIWPPRIRGPF